MATNVFGKPIAQQTGAQRSMDMVNNLRALSGVSPIAPLQQPQQQTRTEANPPRTQPQRQTMADAMDIRPSRPQPTARPSAQQSARPPAQFLDRTTLMQARQPQQQAQSKPKAKTSQSIQSKPIYQPIADMPELAGVFEIIEKYRMSDNQPTVGSATQTNSNPTPTFDPTMFNFTDVVQRPQQGGVLGQAVSGYARDMSPAGNVNSSTTEGRLSDLMRGYLG